MEPRKGFIGLKPLLLISVSYFPMDPRRRLQHLHEWAVGKPIVLVMPSQMIALQVPMVSELAQMHKDGRFIEKTRDRMPKIATWLRMYRRPRQVKQKLVDLFWPMNRNDLPGAVDGFFLRASLNAQDNSDEVRKDNLEKLNALPPEHKATVKAEIENALRFQYWEHLTGLANDLDDHEPVMVDLDEAFKTPEALFFALVLLPCAMEYGELAWDVYDQACRGDRMAIDKLLRIDKLILSDPRINQPAARLGFNRDVVASGLVADAFKATPKFNIDHARAIALMAALISKLWKAADRELTSEQIKDLFDAAEKDRTENPDAIEQFIPETPEARRKSIHRNREFWKWLRKRDMHLPEPCHVDLGLWTLVSTEYEVSTRPTWIDQQQPKEPAREPGKWLCAQRIVERILGRLFPDRSTTDGA